MYKEDKPELEDYLLGKKVDKHIDNHDEILSEKNKGRDVYIIIYDGLEDKISYINFL